MILRSFHIPAGMDEELKMLSFISNENKATLVRKMVAKGLDEAWTELSAPANNRLSLMDVEVDHKTASPRARQIVQERV